MRLETDRLVIRPFTPADEDAAVSFFTDPDFMVWSFDGAMSPDRARARLKELIALYEAHGFSKLAMADKNSGRLIGYCGFGLDTIEGRPTPELGYRLINEVRGTGLATEAARAVIADAFARLGMDFVIATVMAPNMPSRRVLEKLGLTYRRRVMLRERELLLYRLEAPGTASAE